jgi:hypothetical protein
MSAPTVGSLIVLAQPRSFASIRTAFALWWRTLAGMALCQSLLSSMLVVGWTYRLMQRRAVLYWATRGRGLSARSAGYPEFAIRTGCGVRALLRPLAENLKLGAQALLTTWTFTLPACALWQFGWFAGWDNSFNKGYEQTYVGAGIAWIGIAVFIAAMLYLPIAQARHAASGEWRAVFDFRTNRAIAKENRFSNLLLALGYGLAGLPLLFLTIFPYFAANAIPALLDRTPAEQLAWLGAFYFWAALPLFLLFVALRLAATRIYARGVLDLVLAGALSRDALLGVERQAFDELDLQAIQQDRPKTHLALWATRGAGRLVAVALTVVLWFAFTAQIFVGQFFHYRPVQGWLNQPLVQAPWMRHIPPVMPE